METKELEKEIAKKLSEIRDMYYKAYPNGDYLAIAIFKKSLHFNNRHYGDDSEFPIDYWETEDTEDDNESI